MRRRWTTSRRRTRCGRPVDRLGLDGRPPRRARRSHGPAPRTSRRIAVVDRLRDLVRPVRSGPSAGAASTRPITGVAGILYTIPSLALFAALVPITGISLLTAEIPLDPVHAADLRAQHRRGLRRRPARRPRGGRRHGLHRAASACGASSCRWPMPLIVAGVRLATVSTIGLVTVTGVLGDRFGGLGFFIFEGYRRTLPDRDPVRRRAVDPARRRASTCSWSRFQRGSRPWSRAGA